MFPGLLWPWCCSFRCGRENKTAQRSKQFLAPHKLQESEPSAKLLYERGPRSGSPSLRRRSVNEATEIRSALGSAQSGSQYLRRSSDQYTCNLHGPFHSCIATLTKQRERERKNKTLYSWKNGGHCGSMSCHPTRCEDVVKGMELALNFRPLRMEAATVCMCVCVC